MNNYTPTNVDNTDDINKFLKTHKPPTSIQEETENTNRLVRTASIS